MAYKSKKQTLSPNLGPASLTLFLSSAHKDPSSRQLPRKQEFPFQDILRTHIPHLC